MSNIQRDLYPLMELTEADNYDNGNEHIYFKTPCIKNFERKKKKDYSLVG